ncbi:solute carrier family 25 [Capsaspora owczarzaki ATCC 30864]|uniref:Solute carrier family 25 n=1 Tax=Capsaspora owczarzaki (strain ATCC 30864) TaxID=595528 RepID=A0A0D2X0W5_CAPO3|nr:solute carrier family 25 [Capsaspora owczarzaki ATCC 30864]KJE89769.1 solute carrier family 25 [Capsaspora owczarzaki ATCC 30864]|eukprot:XP_004349695.1 solute carrier family 25 [Capsaspora owczarzaki ATCC 30864]
MSTASDKSSGFNWRPFVYGGLASMTAEIFTFPIDTTKTRLQLQGQQAAAASASASAASQQAVAGATRYRGMLHCGYTIAKDEGLLRLYRGIKPALLRQATYGTIKIGVYQSLKKAVVSDPKDESILVNMGCGVIAGAFSSSLATPTDVLKVRMQAQSSRPPYRGLVHAFSTIFKEEGVVGLWRGVIPTAQRAAVITCVELPVYDAAKKGLIRSGHMQDNIYCHFAASFIAGFAGSVASNPIDVVKTRLMMQSTGTQLYSGALDCVRKTVQREGVFALYKGFIPGYLRLGPWNIVFFLTYEQLKKLDV